jgi:hypothetical protein
MQFTEEETRRWLFLRAAEWKNWPSFLSQPVVPVLFIFYTWYYVLGGVLFLDILWAGLRYRYVNVPAATNAVYFVSFCKWPAGIGSAIYLFAHHSYFVGVLAILPTSVFRKCFAASLSDCATALEKAHSNTDFIISVVM